MSTTTASAFLPMNLSEVRTMLVEQVKNISAREKQQKKVAAYITGSLVAHVAVVALLASIPVEDSNVNLSLATNEITSTSSNGVVKEETPAEPEESVTGEDAGNDGGGSLAMSLPEGAAGKPDSKSTGRMQIQKTHTDPAMARQQAIEYARSAGILGDSRALSTAINSLAGEHDYTSGYDTASIYGTLDGTDGEGGRGNFGMGREGFGPGGGCLGAHCGTIPGSSKYDTIGKGPGSGDGYGPGNGHGGLHTRTAKVPNPVGQPTEVTGGLDRSTIRRYIKMHTFKISYCYEQELLARGDLEGNVTVQFLITPSGTVQVSNGAGFDGKVASCVANVVKNIQFPAPKNGGNVQVNYPFSFRRAAGSR